MDEKSTITLGDGVKPEYVISVDNIDLRMLSSFNYQKRDETVPLWSAQSSGPGAEYFEFGVLIDDSGDDANRENGLVQRCYVCEVDVPRVYWGQHKDTAAHRACLAIVDAALQRSRMQMSLDTPIKPTSQSSTYYCPHCSCAVDLTKRRDHENTIQHTKSIIQSELVQTLASLYVNKNNLDDVFEDLFVIVKKYKTGKEFENKNFNFNDFENNATAVEVIKNERIESKDIKVDDVTEANKYDNKPEESSKNADNNEKKENERNSVAIVTQTKAKLRVSLDNYEGLCTVRGYYQCRVCRVVVDDRTQHLTNEEHRRKVDAILNDKHCIRKLDDLYNHCILCNEVIESPEAHVLCSPQHDRFLKVALIEELNPDIPHSSCHVMNIMAENFIKTDDSNELYYFCEPCQVYLFKATLMEHIRNDEHINSLKKSTKKIDKRQLDTKMGYCTLCDMYVNKGKKAQKLHLASKDHKYNLWLTYKDTKLHYHMRKCAFEKEVACCICDVNLLNDVDQITAHVSSERHQTKRRNFLKDNFMEERNDITVFCLICNETEYMIGEIQHTVSRSHSKKRKKYTALGIGRDDLKQMINDPLKKNSKFMDILHINRIENYDASHYECKACYKCINKHELFDHMFSKKHKRFLVASNVAIEGAAEIVNAAQESSDTDENETLNSTVQDNKVVDNTDTVYLKHTTDKDTNINTKTKQVLQKNHIEDKYNTFYHCNPCNRLVPKTVDIHKHISDITHQRQLNQFTQTVDSADNIVLNTNINKTVANDAESRTIDLLKFKPVTLKKKLHYLFEENPIDVNKVVCLVCKVKLSYDQVTAHRKETKHSVNLKALMDANTMFRIKHRCFCECCRKVFKVNEEYIHLTSDRHCLNLSRNTKRMDKKALQELSLKMFHEDIEAEKKAKRDEKYGKLSSAQFRPYVLGDSDEYRFDNSASCFFLNSSIDLRRDTDEEDESVSDSNDEFASARTSVTTEETCDSRSAAKYSEDNVVEGKEEVGEEVGDFIKSVSYLFEDTVNPVELLCKLCHCVIENRNSIILDHIFGVKHSEMYENILLSNELKEIIDSKKEKILKYRCLACGIEVGKFELFAHLNSYKHKLYLTAKPSTSGRIQQTEDEKAGRLSPKLIEQAANKNEKNISKVIATPNPHKVYLLDCNSNNESYCKLCDSDLLDIDLNNHINSKTHQANFEFYLLENEVKKVGVQFFCSLCQIRLIKGTELEHIHGEKHNKISSKSTSQPLTKKVLSNAFNRSKTKRYFCTVCNFEILDIPKFIQIHNESIRHKSNLEKARKDPPSKSSSLTSVNTIEKEHTSEVKSEYFCDVCHVIVPNTPDNIKSHNNGRRHQNELGKLKTKVPPPPLLTESKPKAALSVPTTNALSKPTSSTPTSTNVAKPAILNYVENGFCQVCQINVENKIESIREHLRSKSHNETFKCLKSRLDKQVNESKLSSDNKASSNLLKSNNPISAEVYCQMCKTNVPNKPDCIEEHLKGKCHTKNVEISKSTASSSINSQTKSNQNPINPVSTYKNKVEKSEASEITNPDLPAKIMNYVKHGYCTACKTNVPDNSNCIDIHIKGRNHIQNVKMFETKARETQLVKNKPVKNNQQNQNTTTGVGTSQNTLKRDTEATSVNNITVGTLLNEPQETYFFQCSVCKTFILNKYEYIFNHYKEPFHIEKFQKLTNEQQQLFNIELAGLVSSNLEKTNLEKTKSVNQHPEIQSRNDNVSTNNNNLKLSPQLDSVNVYLCKICKLSVPNNPNNIQEHIRGARHKSNVENLVNMCLPTKVDPNSVYQCRICNLHVTNNVSNITEHFNGKKHKMNVENLKLEIETATSHFANITPDNNSNRIEEKREISDVDKSLQVDTKDVQSSLISRWYNCANVIESHTINNNEVNKLENKVKIDKEIGSNTTDDNKTQRLAQIFRLMPSFATSTLNDAIIIDNRTDSNSESGYTKSIGTTIPKNINTVIANETPRNKDNHSDVNIFNTTRTKDGIGVANISSIGKVEDNEDRILSGDDTIVKSNLSGTSQTGKTGTSIAQTTQVNDAASDLTAAAVNVGVGETDDGMAEIAQGFYICNVCKRVVPNNPADSKSHLKSYHHLAKLNENKSEEGLLPNPEEYYCELCEAKIPNDYIDIKKHDATQKHKIKFAQLLSENKIKIRDDKVCYCDACDLFFSKFSVKAHIARENHRSRIKFILKTCSGV